MSSSRTPPFPDFPKYFPETELQLGSNPSVILNAWLSLFIIGQISLVLLLGTLLCCKRLGFRERPVPLLNLIAIKLLSSICSCLLWYAGEEYNPQPPPGICIAQTILKHAFGPGFLTSVFAYVVYIWRIIYRSLYRVAADRRQENMILNALPWAVIVILMIPVAVWSGIHPQLVHRHWELWYCTVHNDEMGQAFQGIATSLVLLTIGFEGWALYLVHRTRAATNIAMNPSGAGSSTSSASSLRYPWLLFKEKAKDKGVGKVAQFGNPDSMPGPGKLEAGLDITSNPVARRPGNETTGPFVANSGSNINMEVGQTIRIGVFTAVEFFYLVLSASVIRARDTFLLLPAFVEVLLPIIVFLVFGSQKDLMGFWLSLILLPFKLFIRIFTRSDLASPNDDPPPLSRVPFSSPPPPPRSASSKPHTLPPRSDEAPVQIPIATNLLSLSPPHMSYHVRLPSQSTLSDSGDTSSHHALSRTSSESLLRPPPPAVPNLGHGTGIERGQPAPTAIDTNHSLVAGFSTGWRTGKDARYG